MIHKVPNKVGFKRQSKVDLLFEDDAFRVNAGIASREEVDDILAEASQGFEKWKKYFADNKVTTTTSGSNKIQLLDKNGKPLRGQFIPGGETITTLPADSYSPKVRIKWKGKTYRIPLSKISKPRSTKGATENLKINATRLASGANEEQVEWNNKKFSAFVFEDENELSDTVVKNYEAIPEIQHQVPETIPIITKLFDTGKLSWKGLPEDKFYAKNELGKYLGEILIGWYALKNEVDVFAGPAIKDFVKQDESFQRFILPNDPSFSSIDSILEYEDGTLAPISSKSGAGAQASFFTGILDKILSGDVDVDPKETPLIASLAQRIRDEGGIKKLKTRTKQSIYRYLIVDLLNLDPNKISPDVVLKQAIQFVRSGELGKELKVVVDAMKKYNWDDKNAIAALEKLPAAITGILTREIAYDLNNNPKSKDFSLEILGMKDFFQANLNLSKWKKGIVEFKIIKSGDSQIKFTGSKSSMVDVSAKQGTINYRIS